MVHRLSQVLVLATFILLLVGGLVTSTDSGLAVPDWPLSYGSLFPPMVGGVRFEHTHRLVAASVGLLTLTLTLWIGKTETRAPIRWLAIAAFGVVVLQGILGGLTVLFLLPVPISVAHACLGPLFFCLAVSLAVLTAPEEMGMVLAKEERDLFLKRFRIISAVTTFFLFLQIFLGALVRHTGGGVWVHVIGAFFVLFLTGYLMTQALTHEAYEERILRPALFLGFLVTVEFFLGIGAFVFTRIGKDAPPGLAQVVFPTFHQALGALLLATGVVLTLRACLAREPVTV